MIGDPIAAMYAAVQQVVENDVAEIELDFVTDDDANCVTTRTTICVRKSPRSFAFDPQEEP